MVGQRGQELMENLTKIKKLAHKFRPHSTLPNGEFMILASIDFFMNKNAEEGMKLPGIKVSDLSKNTHASAPATSKAIRHLEEKALIERIADEKDRRVVYIALTDGGKKILKEAREAMDNFINRTIEKLGEEDTKQLTRITRHLYDIVLEDISKMSNQEDGRMSNQEDDNKM